MAAPAPVPSESPLVVAFAGRERVRALARRIVARRHGRLVLSRTSEEFAGAMRADLVDAAIVDLGTGATALPVAGMARELPSVAFFLATPLRPVDAPVVARALELGACDVLVDGVDDVTARAQLLRHGFSARFAAALGEPPPPLRLESAVQRKAWSQLVARAGRPVRTNELASVLGMTREHLSRTFAAHGAPTLKRVIDLVRLLAAAELAKNPGYDLRDVARILRFASSSHLSQTSQRLLGRRASSLAALRAVDILDRFVRAH